MKTDQAIELAGGTSALASLLEITPSAVSQWGDNVPQTRVWQLKVVRPEWFKSHRKQVKHTFGEAQGDRLNSMDV